MWHRALATNERAPRWLTAITFIFEESKLSEGRLPVITQRQDTKGSRVAIKFLKLLKPRLEIGKVTIPTLLGSELAVRLLFREDAFI